MPGLAKTRLIPALGAEGAAELHRRMTVQTLVGANTLRDARGVETEVRFCGGTVGQMVELFGNDRVYTDQGDGALGDRLRRAVADAFEAGCTAVAVIGTDCPGLTRQMLADAFDCLTRADVVLGPAQDGGYYLIGMTRRIDGLFAGVPWGTERVLRITLAAADRLGLIVALLPTLGDVDRPEDLPLLGDDAGITRR